MLLSQKHANQRREMFSDFTGGLNSLATEEMIDKTQLSEMMNMEIDSGVGLLRTVRGTENIYKLPEGMTYEYKSAAYDAITGTLFLFTNNNKIFATQDFSSTPHEVGTLTGSDSIVTTMWENGLLIASGGKLQYSVGLGSTTTITSSPEHCNGVYVRSGRVLVFDNADNVLFSGVGDETDWEQDSNDPSSSLFAQIGYKVGGRIIGMVNMTKDILFIKSNGMIFRLENEYPDWNILELGRNVFCRGNAAYCNIGNNQVAILGSGVLQIISTTQDYGDMKPQNIGSHVSNELYSLPATTRFRYVPPLNQLWCITDSKYVLIFDCKTGAFYQRYFNSDCVDVVSVDNSVYVIKKNAICKLVDAFYDDLLPLNFSARFKTNVSLNSYLVKRISVCITPLVSDYGDSDSCFQLGTIRLPFPTRAESLSWTPMAESTYLSSATDDVFLNSEYLTPSASVLFQSRVVYRNQWIRSSIIGSGFPFALNFFSYDVAEV